MANSKPEKNTLNNVDNTIKEIFQLEEEIRKTINILNNKAVELTRLNALRNRGPVDLDDLFDHLLISQNTLENEYLSALKEIQKQSKEEMETELQD